MRLAAVAAVLLLCACGGSQDPSRSGNSSSLELELAKARLAAAQSPDGKVTICHFPPGNRANAHEIRVGEPAVRAHVEQHGDRVGGCCVEAGQPCKTDSDCCQDQAKLVCRVDPSSPTGRSCGGIG